MRLQKGQESVTDAIRSLVHEIKASRSQAASKEQDGGCMCDEGGGPVGDMHALARITRDNESDDFHSSSC